ncbi:HutD family protein [Roseovarius sp. M141]|uniref:HutD/Ves family protein n=1 Tax=Roseovarius sp. M141 TaxID=2583806 RepID=UPI0020CD16A7|nr:HutD family protein [Roseovarius sp. M141]MCQ0091807.1 HutD family protein [Roseovarius sp. M141]
MHRFDLRTIPAQPWVNGAGTRQDLATGKHDSQTVWRLSVAAIDRDCPFSTYPGLARLHTIIGGAGTRLVGAGVDLNVRPMVPVAFDGSIPLDCTLTGGPATAFNILYDPTAIDAELHVLAAGAHMPEAREIAAFCVSGSATMDGQSLEAGQGALTETAAAITVDPSAEVLCAILNPAR